MKIVIYADNGWSIGRVHNDVIKELPEHTFVYHNQSGITQQVYNDINNADILVTTLNNYLYVAGIYRTPEQRKKIVFICHGISEIQSVMAHEQYTEFSDDFTYSVTSHVLVPFHPKKVCITPNGVNESLFNYSEHSGNVETLGWAGAYDVGFKRGPWAPRIAKLTQLPLSIAATLSFDKLLKWYKTIDILICTAGPGPEDETGPLPPFEAIACGIPVIGTFVGNFSCVPGPKFNTIEEAANIINGLKNNPEKVRALAKEQYDFVMEHFTYKSLAKKWNAMFLETYNKSKQ